MIYVSLDAEGLQRVITGLSNYGTKARECRESVKNTNDRNDSPTDLASSLDIISGSADALEDKAKDLQARLDSAKAANESGITPMGADGTISYVIPEGLNDTADTVLRYNHVEIVNQARADAAALYQAKNSLNGRSDDGRTFNEILEGMSRLCDSPIYSVGLITVLGKQSPLTEADFNKSGSKRFLEIMQMVNESHSPEILSPGFENLSHVLASASRKGNGGAEFAEEIYQASSSDYAARLSLNAALSECSAPFGSDFLTHLASAYEKDDANRFKQYSQYINHTEYNCDVLGGVLQAMGKNHEAARKYLGGEGRIGSDGGWIPSDEMKQRWELLKHREWNAAGRTGFTAAMAGAVPDRNLSNDPGEKARATWVAGQSLDYSASVKKDDYTDDMKRNLSVVLANCREEIHSVANGKGTLGLSFPGNPDPANPDKYGRNTLATVLYRVMDNQDAATTISAAVSDYALNIVPDPDNMGGLNEKYISAANDTAFLRDISNQRAIDNNATQNEKYKLANTISSVAIAVGGVALGVATDGVAAPLAYAGTTALVKSLSADVVGKEMGTDVSVQPEVTDAEYLETRQVTEAVNRGFVAAPVDSLYDSRGQLISREEYDRRNEDPSENYSGMKITDKNGHVVQPERYNVTFRDGVTELKDQINNPELNQGVKATRDEAENLKERFGEKARSRGIVIDKS